MEEKPTVEQFIERVERSWREWFDLVSCITTDRASEPGYHRDWTLTDVIAHVTWYEKQMVGLLEARRFEGSELWELPTDERNEIIRAGNAGREHRQVLRDAKLTHERLVRLIGALPDEALHDPSAFPGMPSDWTPAQVLEGNTFHHYDGHAELVRDHLAGGRRR